MSQLSLIASEIRAPHQWYWRLQRGGHDGPFLADQAVELPITDWQYMAFLDLHGYLDQHVAPDRRHENEQRVVRDVGQWIGQHVLGAIGPALLREVRDANGHVTVHVSVAGNDTTAQSPVASFDHHILLRPMELAYLDGKPIALHDVSLVFDTRSPSSPKTPASVSPDESARRPFRMLAVFSLPLSQSALNLRHERHQLKTRLRAMASDRGWQFDLRVLQYGVTRGTLEKLLKEGAGWDVLHFSGHGLASRLVLEKEDGSPDFVEAAELLDLLRPARGRLKWITLSACLSAAATVEETLRWLGLEPRRRDGVTVAADDPLHNVAPRPMPVLAKTLSEGLDCAVLAMRFPVGDQFAIDLGQTLYEHVLDLRQPLDRAMQLALPKLLGDARADRLYPALSVATPALFGRRAAGLTLAPPERIDDDFSLATRETPLAHFPPENERLVGRVWELSQASRALATQSGRTGVLFHGMAGGGKTACANELARQHEEVGRFRAFVWFKAPDDGQDISLALLHFAQALEQQLPGLPLIHLVDRPAELRAFLPRLSELFRKRSILVVVDNLESLLFRGLANSSDRSLSSDTIKWRDELWGDMIDALLMHNGESRIVLTSRLVPPIGQSQFAQSRMQAGHASAATKLLILPVHSLSLDEAALLARELPNLGRIFRGEHAKDGFAEQQHRELAVRMLRLVQGHPKLIELAEGQATDPAQLQSHLDRAESAYAAGAAPLAAFFEQGQSSLGEADFLRVLSDWTQTVAVTLTADTRRLFYFLCGLEEPDRTESIVLPVWPNFLRGLDPSAAKPVETEEPQPGAMPDVDGLLAAIVDTAAEHGESLVVEQLKALLAAEGPSNDQLAQLLTMFGQAQQQASRAERQLEASRQQLQPLLEALFRVGLVERKEEQDELQYGIHPGVAEAGRAAAGDTVQAAVDKELGAYWMGVFQHGRNTEMQGGGKLIRIAGLRAAPYLLRRQQWETASMLLEHVVHLDRSAATVSALLPLLRRIADMTADTERGLIDAGVLASGLLSAGRWQEAERLMLEIDAEAERTGAWRVVSTILGEVINIQRQTGRAEDALAFVERKKQATYKAGLGPWTQLGDDGWRLQLLAELGRNAEVLAEVERLRPTLAALPEQSEQEESVVPWNVRETLIDTGHTAALALGRWEDALALNAEVLASTKARGASDLEQAQTRYNDYGPLLRLRRLDDVRTLLLDCRRVFERHNDEANLGNVFSAQANLEGQLGHLDRSIDAEQHALRYKYLIADPNACAISHFNLANYFRRSTEIRFASVRPTTSLPDDLDQTALAHRLAAIMIRFQTQDGRLANTIRVLRIEIGELAPTSPAIALLSPDGSGFDHVCEIVERIDGVRFRELFTRLPTTRAATGPAAISQVLALAAQSDPEPADDRDVKLLAFVQQCADTLRPALAAGEDLDTLLISLRTSFATDIPDAPAEMLDDLVARVREHLTPS